MSRSLLDTADLAALRQAAEAAGGGLTGVVLACLLDGGAVQHDPDEPEWADRDRLLVDPALPLVAVAEAARGAGYALEEGRLGQGSGRAATDAVRAAAASAAAGDVYRVYLLLHVGSLADGAVWQALVEAGRAALSTLVALVLDDGAAPPPEPAVTLRAGGWSAWETGPDPAEVLAALDHVLDPARAPAPAGVVVRSR